MNVGRITRNVIELATILGVLCLLLFVVFLALVNLFPQFFVASPTSAPMMVGLLLVGIFSTVWGAPFYISVWRTRRRELREIRGAIERGKTGKAVRMPDQPVHLFADSVDREILGAVRDLGGDILAIEDRLSDRALPTGEGFYERLGKLHLLGLIFLSEKEGAIYLTAAGLDALNTPAVLFVSRIPRSVWEHVFQAKIHLSEEKWGDAVLETAKALEAAMRDKLRIACENNPSEWQQIQRNYSGKPIDSWPAGHLLGALRDFNYVKGNSFEDHLASELVEIRNLVHDKKETHTFRPSDAERFDTLLGLLLRSWYGPR